MAKILVSFYNGVLGDKSKRKYAMPIFFDSFVKGLEKYGNDVLVYQHVIFNRKFPPVPDIVEKQIKQFEPDLCILFNNAFFDLRILLIAQFLYMVQILQFIFQINICWKNMEIVFIMLFLKVIHVNLLWEGIR